MMKPQWICHPKDGEENKIIPVFRKRITVKRKIQKAEIFLSAHGIYSSLINGNKITNNLFTPGFTSYYHRIQVQKYDVTNLLNEGENIWETTVADGWWRWNNNFGYRLALWGKLNIHYCDGTKETIVTDKDFEVGTGQYIEADLQKGIIYDARLNVDNWTSVEIERKNINGELIENESILVCEKEKFVGNKIKDNNGNLVIDFKQNICGYVHMVLHHTKQGQIIHLKHGETLDRNGVFTTSNCDGGKKVFQEITYICKGKEREEFTPQFAYFGFRYMLVEGIDDGEFIAIAVYSDMKETGEFKCSNKLINKLVDNARWSQKGNFLEVPVDCPTRERNAWTGDAQIYINTAAYFMDVEKFFYKWLKDQRIEQYSSGKVGITFPSTSSVHNPDELKKIQKERPDMSLAGPLGNGNIGEDSVGWGDSAVWLPYQLYLMYGNKEIIEDHYETAKRWVEYSLNCMKEVNPKYADKDWYKNGDGDYIYDTKFHYGEWNEPLPPSKDVIELFANGGKAEDYVKLKAINGNPEVASAYTKRSCDNLSHMAEILGKKEDVIKYKYYSSKIKEAYNKYLISEDGEIEKGHQAAYVRALALDMVNEEKKQLVINKLKEEIINADYHLNTGFLSTVYLLPTLCDNGMINEAYKLLEQTDCPSWLHPITVGATTIPEKWDGFDKVSDSLNHYSFGAVCQFLFEYVAGIRPTFNNPGFKEIILKPTPGGSLTWAEGSYITKFGKIISKWKIDNNIFNYYCEIPEGINAKLILPNGEKQMLTRGKHLFNQEIFNE